LLQPESFPEAAWEMEGSVTTLEPLLFVLRHLLSRVCADLEVAGKCTERLQLRLALMGGRGRKEIVVPARPTRRERLLYDLCRAALEKIAGAGDSLPAPAEILTLRVLQWCRPGVRQGDLFDADWRDPLAAAAAISRVRARLGDQSVVWPAPRRHHRPEIRSGWAPVDLRGELGEASRPDLREVGSPFSTLRLLPRPAPAEIRTDGNRPMAIRDTGRWKPLLFAEGPERYSGDWWAGAFAREYYRACTTDGEILWVFREARRGGWWLHGWWD
jgi:protein ImuB